MQCNTHTDVAAAGTCTYSGKPFCADCLIEIEGKFYGKPYLDKAIADIRDRATSKNQPNVYMNAGGAAVVAQTTVTPAIFEPPFYRRRWFMLASILIAALSPIAFLSSITGPIYWYRHDGSWARVSGFGKAIYILLSLIDILWLIVIL